jgi:membrane-bound lytic murein transglycosylase B
MNFSTLPAWTKIAAGAAGAFALVGGTVALTAAVTGSSLGPAGSQLVAPTATPASPLPPASAPGATPNPGARAMATAVLEAEAQVLGIQPKELRADFKAGTTVQALAAQKNISQAQFQTQLTTDLKPILDRDVQQATITSTQEQFVLRRVGQVIPNWDHVGRQAPPSPTPTP